MWKKSRNQCSEVMMQKKSHIDYYGSRACPRWRHVTNTYNKQKHVFLESTMERALRGLCLKTRRTCFSSIYWLYWKIYWQDILAWRGLYKFIVLHACLHKRYIPYGNRWSRRWSNPAIWRQVLLWNLILMYLVKSARQFTSIFNVNLNLGFPL